MSLAAKLIVAALVLAVTLALTAMVLRRMIRGERFDKPKPGDMPLPPPSGPSAD